MNKSIEISLSLTFLSKAICKHCGKSPSTHYLFRSKNYYCTPQEIFKYYQDKTYVRSNFKYYFKLNPSFYNSIYYFSDILFFRGFSPNFHKNKNNNQYISMIVCECGNMSWKFPSPAPFNSKLENINRKSKYNYPKKFPL